MKSIAGLFGGMLAFVFGDYLGELLGLGPLGSPVLAAAAIVAIAALNLTGLRAGIGTQLGLMVIVFAGLLSVGLAGIVLAAAGLPPLSPGGPGARPSAQLGTALVFVFLAYGGWSDAATLSAEMRDPRRGITRALVCGRASGAGPRPYFRSGGAMLICHRFHVGPIAAPQTSRAVPIALSVSPRPPKRCSGRWR